MSETEKQEEIPIHYRSQCGRCGGKFRGSRCVWPCAVCGRPCCHECLTDSKIPDSWPTFGQRLCCDCDKVKEIYKPVIQAALANYRKVMKLWDSHREASNEHS